MSTRRRRIRRQTVHLGPTPREKLVAGLAAAGVVGFTVLAVWALRPGGPHPRFGHGLTGGIAHRQSKATLLVVLTFVALIALFSFAYQRAKSGRRVGKGILTVGFACIAVVSITSAFVMPNGLLYHYDPPEIPDGLPEPDATTTLPLPQQTTLTTVAATTDSAPTSTGATGSAPTATTATASSTAGE